MVVSQERLVEEGAERGDAHLASELAKLIRIVDRAVFGSQNVARISAFPRLYVRWDGIAFYEPSGDSFGVAVIGLAERLGEENSTNKQALVERETGCRFHVNHMLASIAVHEVRHRVQKSEQLSLFSSGKVCRFFPIDSDLFVSKCFLASQYCDMEPTEFDAHLIELMALIRFVRGEDLLEVVRSVIRLTPETAQRP